MRFVAVNFWQLQLEVIFPIVIAAIPYQLLITWLKAMSMPFSINWHNRLVQFSIDIRFLVLAKASIEFYNV